MQERCCFGCGEFIPWNSLRCEFCDTEFGELPNAVMVSERIFSGVVGTTSKAEVVEESEENVVNTTNESEKEENVKSDGKEFKKLTVKQDRVLYICTKGGTITTWTEVAPSVTRSMGLDALALLGLITVRKHLKEGEIVCAMTERGKQWVKWRNWTVDEYKGKK
jgi:hypothetical protein